MKVLIDTNVALDLMMDREPFSEDAEKVFTFCCSPLVQGFFSANSIVDMHYLLYRYAHDENYVREIIASWFEMIGIVEILPDDCRNAMVSEMDDYEDAVMVSIAQRKGFDYIVTRNVKDFSSSRVPVVTPSEFISIAMKSVL